jgi:hypothetical protein
LEVFVFKKALFVFMMAGCLKHAAPELSGKAGLYGFAGENFFSTNSPCLDGVIVGIDHSCAVPMEIEEGYPYIMIQCTQVRPEANPWNKYSILAITNPAIEDPPHATMLCVDPYARVYVQKRP